MSNLKTIYNPKLKLFGLAAETNVIIEPCYESISKVDTGFICVKNTLWYKYLSQYSHINYTSNFDLIAYKGVDSGKVLYEKVVIAEWVFLDPKGIPKTAKRFAVLEPYSLGLTITAEIKNNYDEVLKGNADLLINEDGVIVFDRNEMRAKLLASNVSCSQYKLLRKSYNSITVSGEFYRPGKAADSYDDSYLWSYDFNGKFIK